MPRTGEPADRWFDGNSMEVSAFGAGLELIELGSSFQVRTFSGLSRSVRAFRGGVPMPCATRKPRSRSDPIWALKAVSGLPSQPPECGVRGGVCYCAHCHGLGCGGWCRWCP